MPLSLGSWVDDAACRGLDTELFFEKVPGQDVLNVCAKCPVKAECLGTAMQFEGLEYFRAGVWGGLTPQQRNGLPRGW